jgi:PilZ domain
MSDEMLSRVAAGVVAESALEMVDEDGRSIEVWTIRSDGVDVHGSAPRLAVREEMLLTGRLMVDGRPHRVVVCVVEARFQSERRAGLVMRVVGAAVDGAQRQSERVPLSIRGTLTALICDRVVPGEAIAVTLQDVSEGGAGLLVPDQRPRPRDQYRLDLRCMDGVISQTVQVRSTRPGDQRGSQVLGCLFLDPTTETLTVVARVQRRQQLSAGAETLMI